MDVQHVVSSGRRLTGETLIDGLLIGVSSVRAYVDARFKLGSLIN